MSADLIKDRVELIKRMTMRGEIAGMRAIYEAVCDIEAALTPSEEQWQPIETAPKDGTSVLLWEKYSDSPVVGFYHSRREKWYADTEHYDTNGNACVIDKLCQDLIAHWMPLPAPPIAATQEKP